MKFIIAIQPDEVILGNGLRQSFSDRWVSKARELGHEVRIVDVYQNDIIEQLRGCDGIMCFGALSSFSGFKFTRKKGHMKISVEEHNLVPGLYNIDVQIRTIRHDNAYVAYREPRLIVDYPEDKYILKNLAGVFQPNKIVWKMKG